MNHFSIVPAALLVFLFSLENGSAFHSSFGNKMRKTTPSLLKVCKGTDNHLFNSDSFDPLNLRDVSNADIGSKEIALGIGATLLSAPGIANAVEAPAVIPSALAAYGHYLALMGMVACITTERFTIKPNMSDEEEDRLAFADIGTGVFGGLLAYTGYLRVIQYGKGWEFYSHEPIFWLKITFVGIFGAASFFNTFKVIQRSVAKAQNKGKVVEPMSPKLAKRMIQICNAELIALATIPLTASLMARGVAYSESIPWQAGAALSAIVFGGLSFKYIKEAATWKDDEVVAPVSATNTEGKK
mmetsp:Transcript_37828/g.48248  ORF Transcript_37828/g.48248 Transcript_37828/m.48248 type:complete len:299 (+) Transcript_37828:83-979(+)